MKIQRRFTKPGADVFEGVAYERRTSRISNPDGSVVFERNDAQIPKQWSQLATDIMVSKYFRKAGVPVVDPATGLPPGAVLVTETPDYKVGFVAPEDGTIYIFQRGKETFRRYSGPSQAGANFTIDPETNVAMVDQKELDIVVPSGGAHYQVYFRPAPGSAGIIDD